MEVCPVCGEKYSMVVNDQHEIVCSKCGSVIEVEQYDWCETLSSYREVKFTKRYPTEAIYAGSDFFPEDLKMKYGGNAQKFAILQREHFISKVSNKKSTIYRSFKLLDRICGFFKYPHDVRNHAAFLYMQLLSEISKSEGEHKKRHNHAGMIIACVYAAAREYNFHVCLRELIEYVRGLGRDVATKKVFEALIILKKKGLYRSKNNIISYYLNIYTHNLLKYCKYSKKNSELHGKLTLELAYRMLNYVKSNYKHRVQSKNPRIVAAAIAYLALKYSETGNSIQSKSKRVTVKEASQITGVSLSSLRRAIRDIENMLIAGGIYDAQALCLH